MSVRATNPSSPEPSGAAHAVCPGCGSTEARHRGTEAGFLIVECIGCALFSIRPMPFESGDLDWTYGSLDHATSAEFRSDKRQVAEPALIDLGRRHPGRGLLLDIGCGLGAFLEMAADDGWDVIGLDLSWIAARAGSRASGRPVACGSLSDAPFRPGSARALTLWNVLEHLPDPRGALRSALTALEPGGTVVVRVPNMRFHAAAHRLAFATRPLLAAFGKRMPPLLGGIAPPRHVLGFTPTSLQRILETSGFVDVSISPGRAHADPWGTSHESLGSQVVRALAHDVVVFTAALQAVTRGRVALTPTIEARASAGSAELRPPEAAPALTSLRCRRGGGPGSGCRPT
jgi:SAM-dependent methyltransferase